mgnify:CR=1 FL=1
MADYSTDNLKQSQQFLQAYDKLYSFKNTFYDLLASLEKTLGLTEYLSHISVIQLSNENIFRLLSTIQMKPFPNSSLC